MGVDHQDPAAERRPGWSLPAEASNRVGLVVAASALLCEWRAIVFEKPKPICRSLPDLVICSPFGLRLTGGQPHGDRDSRYAIDSNAQKYMKWLSPPLHKS